MKKKALIILAVVFVVAVGLYSGALKTSLKNINQPIISFFGKLSPSQILPEKIKIVDEESVVIDIVEKLASSVVTVGIEQIKQTVELDPFDPFGFFNLPRRGETQKIENDIGSGFIVSGDGLVVTNKHVVSQSNAKYKVITSENKTFEVTNIYRDPANDIAILKIDPAGESLKPVEMGDSSNIKVGQTVIVMGTPLGEFRGTVTKGIISGLGRGITAGSPFEGYVEKLDDVIQTDAAINPGNSGGPLINSSAQVIAINTAVAAGAENIGFALPINLVKEALKNFQNTGSFERAYLGVSYQMVTRELSIMNNIPEGAYVREVIEGTAAEKGGLEKGDIITHFDNERVQGEDTNSLAKLINKKKVGDKVKVKIWRNNEEKELEITMGEYISQ